MKKQYPFFNILVYLVAGSILILPAQSSLAQSMENGLNNQQQKEIQKKYGLNPTASLISRVGDASDEVLKTFRDAGMSPKKHVLTDNDRKKINDAFNGLSPLHKKVLLAHLRTISFLDDMPNTALTSTINPDDPFPIFDITFRAGILTQNLSEWITEKERTCFNTTGSDITVTIEAGTMDAIAYVLMHETTHVVDGSVAIAPGKNSDKIPANSFVSGVWKSRTVISFPYNYRWLDSTRFRRGPVVSIKLADSIYTALEHTPFVSLYSSSSWHEDLAEFVSVYDFTQIKKQPFRIILRDGKKEMLSYEPMKSRLVRERIKYIKRFYGNS